MGSRRRRVRWRNDDVVQLCAHLEYLVKRRSETGTWSTRGIVFELAQRLKPRSEQQIEKKLWALWRGSNVALSKAPFEDVFKYGVRCLHNLSFDLKSRVYDRLKDVEYEAQLHVLNTPQTLRNGKHRSISVESPRSFSNSRSPKKAFKWRSTTRQSRRVRLLSPVLASSEPDRLMTDDPMTSSRDSSSSKRQIENAVKEEGRSLLGKEYPDPDILTEDMAGIPALSVSLEVADSYEDSSDSEAGDSEELFHDMSAHEVARIPLVSDGDPSFGVMGDERVQRVLSKLQKVDASDFYNTLLSLLGLNAHLQQEHARLEEAVNVWKEKWRMQKSIHQRTIEGRSLAQVICEELESKVREVMSLKTMLRAQEHRERFSGPLTGIRDVIGDVKSAHEQLKHCICGLTTLRDFDDCQIALLSTIPEGLKALIWRSLGHKSLHLSNGTVPAQYSNAASPSMMIPSIVGAAVCEWVFLQDTICALLLSTPLISQYKQQLTYLYGHEALYEIDLAAHTSIIKDKQFRQIYLKNTAAMLTEKLLKIIAVTCKIFESFKRANQVRTKLREIFFHALIIKHGLLLTKNRFEVIWAAPGSFWDSSCLEKYPQSPGNAFEEYQTDITPKVQLTLVPGIRCYHGSRKPSEIDVFLRAGETVEGSSELISMAVVSLGQTPPT